MALRGRRGRAVLVVRGGAAVQGRDEGGVRPFGEGVFAGGGRFVAVVGGAGARLVGAVAGGGGGGRGRGLGGGEDLLDAVAAGVVFEDGVVWKLENRWFCWRAVPTGIRSSKLKCHQ